MLLQVAVETYFKEHHPDELQTVIALETQLRRCNQTIEQLEKQKFEA
ncbi:MAG: hypothetical protein HC842_06790 [Cytophagales bacterium]|nr:hypothetical protein [Cytophagales bacterium]